MLSGTGLFSPVRLAYEKRCVMSKDVDTSRAGFTRIDDNSLHKDTDKWFTRFIKSINQYLNPNHAWFDYDKVNEFGESVTNQITQDNLTGAQKAANQFTADEAQKQRDWEMEMQNTAYQRQVADMRAAGVNPAMAMNNGQPSTPSGASASSVSPAPGAGVSMSELMQMFMLPLTKKAAEANIENTEAKTERERAETDLTAARTENMALVNAYYPSVTEVGLDKVLSAIGVDLSLIDRNDAETALKNVQTLISEKENKYADEFFHWRSEYEKAHTQESKDSAAAHAAQALLTAYENQYARENGFKLSSSATLAVVSAIEYALGLNSVDGDNSSSNAVADAVKNHPGVNAAQAAGMDAGEKTRQKIKKAYDRFERWRNKPKRVF